MPSGRIEKPSATTENGLLMTLALSLLFLPGCSVKHQWVHSDKSQHAFYHDDAKCLELSNKVLFEQLQASSPQKAPESGSSNPDERPICLLPDTGSRIHQQCMEELGWELK